MDSGAKQLGSTQSVYHRLLQPAYERMIIQHVYRNKISLKSGALGQLVQKRPKTTGYLGKKYESSSYPASTYWNPSATDQWHWQTTIPPTAQSERARSLPFAHSTDEQNLKTSSRANTFSATTRVREVPISGVYKKEIQEFRSRTPSARGVRATALTNRSRVASQCASARPASVITRQGCANEQSARLQREHEQLELTRERKRLTQIASHRIDRMYYMNGSSSQIHSKYTVSDDELSRIRSIAISRGIRIPAIPYAPPGHSGSKRASTVSGPHSTPRGTDDENDYDEEHQGSQRTVIPTADDASFAGDLASNDGTEKTSSGNTKEDRATSDNEGDDLTRFDVLTPRKSPPNVLPEKHSETLSVKSDTAIITGMQQSATFITEAPVEAESAVFNDPKS